jgi:hypothetical protein
MAATRITDDLQVMLKYILPAERPRELNIYQVFSDPVHANKPHNHCPPLLTVIQLQHPEPQQLMVFSLLYPFNQSEIQTFREFVIFFTQICEARPGSAHLSFDNSDH